MMLAERQVAAVPAIPGLRAFSWLLRREIWEHRKLWLVPGVIVGLVLAALVVAFLRADPGLPPSGSVTLNEARDVLTAIATVTGMLLFLFMPIVWALYCLDALNTERRNRSILFWKSLPVSDTATVLSKLVIVTVIGPLFLFVAALVFQVIVTLSMAIMLALRDAAFWGLLTTPSLLTLNGEMLLGLGTLSLQFLPLFGWFLLVSAAVRRSVTLWAVLPPLAVAVIERIGFGTTHFGNLLLDRIGTGLNFEFTRDPAGKTVEVSVPGSFEMSYTQMTQVEFGSSLSAMEIAAGAVVALVFIAGAILVRRYREL